MDTLMSAVAPRSPAPVKKPSEVDFRSGATLDQLSSQVSELVLLEQGEFGDQTALEVHTAKDFIFNMLGMSADVFLASTPQTDANAAVVHHFWLILFVIRNCERLWSSDGVIWLSWCGRDVITAKIFSHYTPLSIHH